MAKTRVAGNEFLLGLVVLGATVTLQRLDEERAVLEDVITVAKSRQAPRVHAIREEKLEPLTLPPRKRKRRMSAAGRAAISAAQKARWEKIKKDEKKKR